MNRSKYEYFIAGRWRNKSSIRQVLEVIRSSGKSAYCFIENEYHDDGISIDTSETANVDSFMLQLENLEDWQNNPTAKQIFESDMTALKESSEFVLVFPAGLSAHMELGAAYGLGLKCYAIGQPDKFESLYFMLDNIFPSVETLLQTKVGLAA